LATRKVGKSSLSFRPVPSFLLVEAEADEIDRVQSVTEDNRLQDYFYEAMSVSRSGHCAASSDNPVPGPG